MSARARRPAAIVVLALLGVVGACGGDDITSGPASASGGGSTPSPAGRDGGADATLSDATVPAGTCVGASPYDAWVADPKMCVFVYAEDLGHARQMAFSTSGELFVNDGAIVVLWDADGNGAADHGERAIFGSATGLNHGVAFSPDGRYLYASSPTTVYRWTYAPGQRAARADPEIVVDGIPPDGHNTRTLAFDSQGRLFVTVGSASNVDTAQADFDARGQIRRFALPSPIPAGGVAYAAGEIVARGMRNEVGIHVDSSDRVWAVENGRDDLSDPNFGGDIHSDNPAEEINLVDGQGTTFFGYPLCYSEGKVDGGRGPGTQWADKTLDPSLMKTDAWCQDPANVRAPVGTMQAHWAPLGVTLYTGRALPFAGDLVIAAHGSWDRSPPVGRVLARARVAGGAIASVTPIVGQKNGDQLAEGAWDARPVDVRQGPDGALYFSDDLGGRIFKVGYRP